MKKHNERNAGRKPISYLGKRHVINIGICPETWASDVFQAIPNKSSFINALIKRELNIL